MLGWGPTCIKHPDKHTITHSYFVTFGGDMLICFNNVSLCPEIFYMHSKFYCSKKYAH